MAPPIGADGPIRRAERGAPARVRVSKMISRATRSPIQRLRSPCSSRARRLGSEVDFPPDLQPPHTVIGPRYCGLNTSYARIAARWTRGGDSAAARTFNERARAASEPPSVLGLLNTTDLVRSFVPTTFTSYRSRAICGAIASRSVTCCGAIRRSLANMRS
jgi:hypothetical protein